MCVPGTLGGQKMMLCLWQLELQMAVSQHVEWSVLLNPEPSLCPMVMKLYHTK